MTSLLSALRRRALMGVLVAAAVASGALTTASTHRPHGAAAHIATADAIPESGAPAVTTGWTRTPQPGRATAAGRASAIDLRADAEAPSGGTAPAGIARSVQADAYGINLEPLAICVSCTTAQAGHNSSSAEGRELRLGSEPVSEGQSPANGYRSGSLVALPANPLLSLAIAGWDGVTRADRSSSEAHARGSLLDIATADPGLAALTVGDSASDATYDAGSSHAGGQTDAAQARAGGGLVAVVLLHSEGSSDRAGRAYVASVNGAEVLPSGLTGPDGGMTVPRLVGVVLLRGDAAGGLIGSASDGRSQRVIGIGSTWVGRPSEDPQPLR